MYKRQVFKSMLADVNQSQQQSTQLAASFERGQNQDLAGVMIAQQKSRLAFQTTCLLYTSRCV